MNFSVSTSIEILERTPGVLIAMLQNVSADWTITNEGEKTWSAYDIVGHLIEGEKTDWIPRMDIILSDNAVTGVISGKSASGVSFTINANGVRS